MENLSTSKKQFFEIVQKFFSLHKLSHAYLIEVDDYDVDMTYIYEFVKMILCPKKEKSLSPHKCSSCNICNLIDLHQYPDLLVIEPEGQWIKKNQLLNVKAEYQNKSMLDNKRIYIIKQADKLNVSSANTILKFLEEPEEDIIAILLTTSRYQVLETILSRCQVLSLKEPYFISDYSPETLLFLKYIVKKDDLFIHYSEIVDQILIDKEKTKKVILDLENIFMQYFNYKVDNTHFSCNDEVVQILQQLNMQQIMKMIQILEAEKEKLAYNINYKLWLDSLFAQLIGV